MSTRARPSTAASSCTSTSLARELDGADGERDRGHEHEPLRHHRDECSRSRRRRLAPGARRDRDLPPADRLHLPVDDDRADRAAADADPADDARDRVAQLAVDEAELLGLGRDACARTSRRRRGSRARARCRRRRVDPRSSSRPAGDATGSASPVSSDSSTSRPVRLDDDGVGGDLVARRRARARRPARRRRGRTSTSRPFRRGRTRASGALSTASRLRVQLGPELLRDADERRWR